MQAACRRIGRLEAFLYLAAQNFKLISNIGSNLKNQKPFLGLSNGATLMQILSDPKVPLTSVWQLTSLVSIHTLRWRWKYLWVLIVYTIIVSFAGLNYHFHASPEKNMKQLAWPHIWHVPNSFFHVKKCFSYDKPMHLHSSPTFCMNRTGTEFKYFRPLNSTLLQYSILDNSMKVVSSRR